MIGRMAIRDILKMGDARLLRVAQAVTDFDTDELHRLVRDLVDTMRAADGAGLAAPQIGVDLQVVIFGSDAVNPRYPDAPPVPRLTPRETQILRLVATGLSARQCMLTRSSQVKSSWSWRDKLGRETRMRAPSSNMATASSRVGGPSAGSRPDIS